LEATFPAITSNPTRIGKTEPKGAGGRMAEDTLCLVTPVARNQHDEWIDDTIAQLAVEHGMTERLSLAGQFPRSRLEELNGGAAAVREIYYRRGWTDGLPIVPPTTDLVARMLSGCQFAPDRAIAVLDPLCGVATVELVAANAVMAGCAPEQFSAVLAAVIAIDQPDFNLLGAQTTDENVAPLLILNGPARHRMEVNCRFGALGPGWRGNACIGRALRLVMNNIGGGWPHAVSYAGLAQPGRYTLVIGEDEEHSPWPPLHVDAGFRPDQSVLTVQRAETCINVTGGLAEIASVMGSAASLFGMLHDSHSCVVLAPVTAQDLAAEGWSKRDVAEHLYREGRMDAALLEKSWLFQKAMIRRENWPQWVQAALPSGSIPVASSAERITIVVAGGDVPITQHAYLPSWGTPPCRIMLPID
jgi:hypothetical protein